MDNTGGGVGYSLYTEVHHTNRSGLSGKAKSGEAPVSQRAIMNHHDHKQAVRPFPLPIPKTDITLTPSIKTLG